MDDKEFVSTTDNDFEKVEVPQKSTESESNIATKDEKSAEKTNYLCCGTKLLCSLDPKGELNVDKKMYNMSNFHSKKF
ncbi:DgyrCDS8699 [Dimorphilus gyrociliatus]|uniref:DgyrCDS8699 n=1 Tax=Dimorphilus gyrociliatus TaxID=2664684 RepID=A0A7I8VV59_9ANNE|nr:DgyrCDS8699 [Dimorphilus gyrociliatus]